jgi:hypothetical protein
MDTALPTRLTEWNQAATFPLANIVSRYCDDTNTTMPVALRRATELKRYLSISAQHPGHRFPMVQSLDPLWHTFIIFTREYHEFCNLLGAGYLHHAPHVGDVDVCAMRQDYRRFLDIYKRTFGPPPGDIWPEEIHGECGGGDCQSNCAKCR